MRNDAFATAEINVFFIIIDNRFYDIIDFYYNRSFLLYLTILWVVF